MAKDFTMGRSVTKDELFQLVGEDLGQSDWMTIDQQRVSRFADVTEDHQFIHVDPERARATPLGTTIAHGLLTLSMIVRMCVAHIPQIEGTRMLLNYGFDKVRFPAPVKVGSRIRAAVKLADAFERSPGQVMMKLEVVIEIEHEEKPGLVAEWLTLHAVDSDRS
jgi:acyl dehydratase